MQEDQAGKQATNHNRPTCGRGFKLMVSRGGREKGSRAELKARLERDEREQGEIFKRKEKRKLDLSCLKEWDMVMNGGVGWVRRSKRVVEQRSKKAKQEAAEMRNQGKGHLLIPENDHIMQVSSDSAISNSSEKYIDIVSTTNPTLTNQRGRHGHEADEEELVIQPAPLAIDDSTVDRNDVQGTQRTQREQRYAGVSKTCSEQRLEEEQSMGNSYSGGLDTPPGRSLTGAFLSAMVFAMNPKLELKSMCFLLQKAYNFASLAKKVTAKNEKEASEADLQTAKMQVEATEAAEETKKRLEM
ncbi:hypothetical protein IFM89_008189 [Coptis chinensis]|uniref:Uncharacterized protein n=1 Tax=Coptis chinensis TaxID=261450 RepID=A0A835I054_9MAGN|nr:hypothetical protein IFM89_008189 [Coptis chinensis]